MAVQTPKTISPVWKGKVSARAVFDAESDDDDDEPSFTRAGPVNNPARSDLPPRSVRSSTRGSPEKVAPARIATAAKQAVGRPSRSRPAATPDAPNPATHSASLKRSLPPSLIPPPRRTRARAALEPTQAINLPAPAPPPLKLFKWQAHGSGPSIVYSTCADEIEQLVPCLRPGPLSFDMEWPVTFGKRKENKTALLQVSDGKLILLIQISSMLYKIPPSLLSIIHSPTRLLYGVNIRGDARKLARDFPHLALPRGFVDLSHIAREVAPDRWGENRRMLSLAKLTESLVGEELEKPKERTSNWAKPLTERQRNYAASDVQSGWAILQRLQALHAERDGQGGAETWDELLLRLSGDASDQPVEAT